MSLFKYFYSHLSTKKFSFELNFFNSKENFVEIKNEEIYLLLGLREVSLDNNPKTAIVMKKNAVA